MEPQQEQQQLMIMNEEGVNGGSGGGGKNNNNNNNYLCRQTSTRWTPTSDQIRILKELYYNNGVRSPTAEQIQRISARLRQYGKIEGKNVFYWFQNHKARERQKKRFTNNNNNNNNTDHPHFCTTAAKLIYTPGLPSPSPSSSSSSSIYCYGSVPMEKTFRECSISAGCQYAGSNNNFIPAASSHNFGWTSGGSSAGDSHDFFDRKKSTNLEEQYDQIYTVQPIETLPLFPMHGEREGDDISGRLIYPAAAAGNWLYNGNGGSRTSLELSLNSYASGSV